MDSHRDSLGFMGTRRPTSRKNLGNCFLFFVINLICLGSVVVTLMKYSLWMKKQGVHNVHEAKWIASVELLIFTASKTWVIVVRTSPGLIWKRGWTEYRSDWIEPLLPQIGLNLSRVLKCIIWSSPHLITTSLLLLTPLLQPTKASAIFTLKPCGSKGKIAVKSLKLLGT